MLIQYQSSNEHSVFRDRFGLACPAQAALIRPGDPGVFVRRPRGDTGGASPARFEAATGRWGLIPLFAKEREYPFTNEARGESAFNERNFHQPWKRGHRCVVLVDALFRTGDSTEQVVRVARADGRQLALAGLWNGWRSPAGECVESFAILTLAAQDHPGQRRAVFLRDAWVDDWLHCPVEETSAYLRPYAIDKLVRHTMARDPATMPLPAVAPAE